jgi:uncharacterized protein (DUF433 family)
MGTQIAPGIARTERGLVVAGTRITLYDILEFLHAGWSEQEILAVLPILSAEQLRTALDFIEEHRDAVEAEYQQVVAQAEENRRYWEARLQEHLAQLPQTAPTPQQIALRAKLARQRAQRLQRVEEQRQRQGSSS